MNQSTTQHFTAPWGRALRWISILSTVVCIAVTATDFLTRRYLPEPWVRLWLPALPMLILAGAAPFIIRGYTIKNDALLIHRLWWDTRVPLRGLISAEVNADAMKRCLRLGGNGGLYSFTGWYWSKGIGRFSAYVTDLTRTVVMRYKHRTIVVSPESPGDFAAALKAHLTATPP